MYGGNGDAKSFVLAMKVVCHRNKNDDTPPYYGQYPALAVLVDDLFIVIYHIYRPGDVNVIAMMHPTNFTISSYHLVSYIVFFIEFLN